MKKYEKTENPEFSEAIDIFEVTDRGHADVLNVPVKQLYENTLANRREKVDKVEGKGLSANDFTSAYKTKLDGVAAGAQVNSITGVKGNAESAYRTGDVNLTPANIGLGKVENKSSLDIRGDLTSKDVTDALGYTPVNSQGSVSGVKGNVESAYRTGNVNLTAEQVGAFPKYSQTVDLSESTYDQGKWYPVTGTELPRTQLNLIDLEVSLNSGTKPSWSTHNNGFSCSLTVLSKGHSYGMTNGETIILNHGCRWTNNVNPCGFSQLTYTSTPVLWLRGGGKYFVNTSYNCAWTPRTSTFNPSNYGQTVAPTTTFPGVAFPVKDTIYANLNGTASTASKLSTARKIGNASFDGSKDIGVVEMGATPLVSTYISPVTAGWYRFAKFQAGNDAGAQGAVDLSCIISIKRTFANGTNETHRIQFLGIYQNAKFVPIASRTNTKIISKIRYVTEGSTAYLDFYYARSVQNDIRITIEDPIASDGRIWSALSLTQVPETATGETVRASMDIPNTTASMVTLFQGGYSLETDNTCNIALGSFPYDIYAVTTNCGVFLVDGGTIGFRSFMYNIRNQGSSFTLGNVRMRIQTDSTKYTMSFYNLSEHMVSESSVTANAPSLDITTIVGYKFS